MNKALLFCVTILFFGCNNSNIEKPKNLIDKDKMVDIYYDISLLEAVKTQNIEGGINGNEINEFIYKKYKIDSIQFIKSNKYYASDIADYKKMFQKVKDKLDAENKKLEAQINANSKSTSTTIDTIKSDTPAIY